MLLLGGFASSARAADYQNLPVVKPVVSCDQLAKAELGQAVGASVTIKSATGLGTEKGKNCRVSRTIAPAVDFEVDMPMEHWTQRYLEAGCGGMCGSVRTNVACTVGRWNPRDDRELLAGQHSEQGLVRFA